MDTYCGIRKSAYDFYFWTSFKTGNSIIHEVGMLQPGNYVLQIKTNQTGAGYYIAGHVYYFI